VREFRYIYIYKYIYRLINKESGYFIIFPVSNVATFVVFLNLALLIADVVIWSFRSLARSTWALASVNLLHQLEFIPDMEEVG